MKRLFNILLFSLLANVAWAQSGVGYDPESPADPDVYYTLRLEASPRAGGSVNFDRTQLRFGEERYIYAYPRLGYEFKQWMEGDSVVSTNPYFYYEMPDHNVTLTAYFEWNPYYNPENPGDPMIDGYRHNVRVYSSPSAGGYFNQSSFTLTEGENQYIWVYPYDGYRFVGWMYEDKIVSTDNPLYIKMGLEDITYIAKFVYDPESPEDPAANLFDPTTGEVVIDNFRPGYLSSALWNAVGDKSSAVRAITIVGKMQNYDYGFAHEYRNCTVIDLSRTAGFNEVPEWSFEYMDSLTKVVLPASIEKIGLYAFAECRSLSELICYAPTPPVLDKHAFGYEKEQEDTLSIMPNLIIKVPAASLPLYQAADVWEQYTILPLDEETCNMTINLPQDANDGRYKNMFIEMENILSGQSFRYLITDRASYTFSNLIINTSYSISIKNSAGAELGRKDKVELGDEDVTVTFESLLQPKLLTAKVLTPDGEDVTAQTAISWFKADGTPLKQGVSINGILEGTMVKARVTLPSTLAMQYLIPSDMTHTVLSSENEIVFQLHAFQTATLSGRIMDLTTNQSVIGATVTISQELNCKYTKSTTVLCGKDGTFSTTVFNAPSSVTFSAGNYISQTRELKSLENNQQLGDVYLKAITGAVLSLSFTYTESVEEGQTAQVQNGYSDAANITYYLFNQTQDTPISEFNVQNGEIVLLEEVNEGDTIIVKALSRKELFNDVIATATIDDKNRASATIPIVALGGLKARFTENENKSVVGILYSSDGVLLSKSLFDSDTLSISDLADGEYTLVTMGSSKFFNSVLNISELSNAGLVPGKDYVKNAVKVESGVISKVVIDKVPAFDESKFYYTGTSTSFTANKPTVVVGNYQTLTGRIDFKPEFADSVKNVQLIVDLPQNCSFIDNSVIIGNSTSTYMQNGNQIIIPLSGRYSDLIRFCVIPTAGGIYAPSATVQFNLYGDTIVQPIGSANYTAKDLSIIVPAIVAQTRIPISGTATGKSTIDIYDNGVLIGQTTSLANGNWATTCELYDTTNLSKHQIFAKVTTKTGLHMQSETKTVTYDKDAILVSKVSILYSNPEIGQNYNLPFNFLNPSTTPLKYVYYIYNRRFNFTIEFNTSDTARISNVILYVKTGDGIWNPLRPKLDRRTGKWMVSAEFGDMYDGIVPVNVSVEYVINAIKNHQQSGCPDADVSIDPSGYVYEAVSSNRLQGVTATVYYMETTEDMYGVLHNEPVLWDAEEYAQENPLFTDENGMYRWDVPQGLWQVKFEKEGYETTTSEWLPVPPPQLEVNVGMTQIRQPEVKLARAYKDGIDIEFDKYMLPALLNTDNILVTQGTEKAEGTIKMLNEEVAYKDESVKYVSKIRFVPNTPFTATEVTLTINNNVMSYAGLQMQDNYQQTFDIEQEITAIRTDSLINIAYGTGQKINISVLPGTASAGKILYINTSSAMIASVKSDSCVLDKEGKASFTLTGELPGSAILSYSIKGYDIKAKTIVNVEMLALETCATPIASITTGSVVDKGTEVRLTCKTEGSTIYYTIDGSDPVVESQTTYKYDGTPIVINDSIVIKVIATANNMYESDIAKFEYKINVINAIDRIAADDNRILLYPLPVQDILNVYASGKTIKNVRIVSLTGATVTSQNYDSSEAAINVNELISGIYIIVIQTNDGTYSYKIIKSE